MMGKTRNEVILAGRLGRDPERKENGPFRFSLATGGGRKKDGREWPIEWRTIVAWPKSLPEAAHLRKGQFVTVSGRLSYPEWIAADGQKRKSVEITITTLIGERVSKMLAKEPAEGIPF